MPDFFRSLMPTLFGFLGGLLAACAVATTRADPPPQAESSRVHEVIRANKIELVADNGKVLGTWSCKNRGGEDWAVTLSIGEHDAEYGKEGITLHSEYRNDWRGEYNWGFRGVNSHMYLWSEAKGERTQIVPGGVFMQRPNSADTVETLSPDDIMELSLSPDWGITMKGTGGPRFDLGAHRKGETFLRLDAPVLQSLAGAHIIVPFDQAERSRLEIRSFGDDEPAVFPSPKEKKQNDED